MDCPCGCAKFRKTLDWLKIQWTFGWHNHTNRKGFRYTFSDLLLIHFIGRNVSFPIFLGHKLFTRNFRSPMKLRNSVLVQNRVVYLPSNLRTLSWGMFKIEFMLTCIWFQVNFCSLVPNLCGIRGEFLGQVKGEPIGLVAAVAISFTLFK